MNNPKQQQTPAYSSRIEKISQQLLMQAASGHWFTVACATLALICSLFAFPVIPIILSACMLAPRRWRAVAFSITLGCALGATILVTLFHFYGWALVYKYFPEFLNHPAWQGLIQWVSKYGVMGLLVISASPLPEMPALIILSTSKPDIIPIFLAVLAGKMIKYGFIAWVGSHFPDQFMNGLSGLWKKLWRWT
jgi:membrane protein YqaA with SNARE-associated domain